MGKRKKKKRNILKHLAKKRGNRSRRRKRVARPKMVASAHPGTEEKLKEALEGSAGLTYAEELSDIHFPSEDLTSYLEEVRKRETTQPAEFLREGVSRLSTPAFLSQVKEKLLDFQRSAAPGDPRRTSSSVVVRALEAGIPPSSIPFFAALLVRDAKNHPLSDDAGIWKLIYPFIPSRILTPGKRPEEKESEYPHLILPDSIG